MTTKHAVPLLVNHKIRALHLSVMHYGIPIKKFVKTPRRYILIAKLTTCGLYF